MSTTQNIDETYIDSPTPALIMYQIHHMEV